MRCTASCGRRKRSARIDNGMVRSVGAVAVVLAGLLLSAPTSVPAGDAEVLAPGYTGLGYSPPEPGSYALPRLWAAADGLLLDSSGRKVRLHELMGDRAVVMSFIYTHCNDVNGCPLATFVLSQLQAPVLADPELRDGVRLITVSFDPARDTPKVMSAYGARFLADGFDWRFLTGTSATEMIPLLEAYDQSTQVSQDEQGVIAHVLRVLLIDADRNVRNVYNTSFLHTDTVLADLRTVLAD